MRLFYTSTLFTIIISSSYCQNYTRDMGLRGGTFSGISYRQYYDETSAFETMVTIGQRGLRFIALHEFFTPTLMKYSDNLSLVYGYGVNVGISYTNKYNLLFRTYKMERWKCSPLIGLNAIVGLQYHFREFPLILAVDYKPFFEFSTYRIFNLFLEDTSLAIRYVF